MLLRSHPLLYILFLQILKDALAKLHADGEKDPFYQPVHTYVLNPKVISIVLLY